MNPNAETSPNHLLNPQSHRSAQVIVHPLFDAPEQKVDVDALGPMNLTRGARWALGSLRFYLIAVILLASYRVLGLAGVLGHR